MYSVAFPVLRNFDRFPAEAPTDVLGSDRTLPADAGTADQTVEGTSSGSNAL